MSSTHIRIAEEFASINGEGTLVGVPTYFVRFAGCSVSQCPLHPYRGGDCDTDWQCRETVEVERVAERAQFSRCHWLCITGGEPLDQAPAMYQLIRSAHEKNMRVTVQTSGAKEVTDEVVDWLVVSPKSGIEHLVQRRGHELKVVNMPPMIVDYGTMRAWSYLTSFLHLWLQPVWKKDGTTNAEDTAAMVQRSNQIGAGPWKLSLQQHKYWGGK